MQPPGSPPSPDESPPGSKVESLFNQAAELAPSAQKSFLDAHCVGDPELRKEIEALLDAHQEAEDGALLETHELGAAGAGKAARLAAEQLERAHPTAGTGEQVGEWIGRYRLLEQIGEGGFGTVYMAEQREPVRRRVAVKILKAGMDTKRVIARFQQERQALALLDHPNIARVIDGGETPGGRPFFVMELVRGINIVDYCESAKLSVPERIQLFLGVCAGVQHAHQKGIIHRDLKPSNVLVTLNDGIPLPKVIDFGVAKATSGDPMTDLTLFTGFEEMLGTPLYMAPEQAEMSALDTDTRSDIYSLGVVLYELLTGRTPRDREILARAGDAEIRHIVQHSEATRPSLELTTASAEARTTAARNRQTKEHALIGILRGDLDWIVVKSLERDRERRYRSVSHLAADLERYLAKEPVMARAPSTWYRLQRFTSRHRAAVAAMVAITVIFATSIPVSLSQAARAERHADRSKATIATLRATAPAYLEQARQTFAEGDVEDAITQIDYAIKLRPDLPDFAIAKADMLMADFRFAQAERAYRDAEAAHPGFDRAHQGKELSSELGSHQKSGRGIPEQSAIALYNFLADGSLPDPQMAKALALLDEITYQTLSRLADGNHKRFYKKNDGWYAHIHSPKTADLEALQGLRITDLEISNGALNLDLRMLADLPLEKLILAGDTLITDLSPLRGSKLAVLRLDTFEGDLSPLLDIPTLKTLFVPRDVENLGLLRDHPGLEHVSQHKVNQPSAHFWAGWLMQQNRTDEALARLAEEKAPISEVHVWFALGVLSAVYASDHDYGKFFGGLFGQLDQLPDGDPERADRVALAVYLYLLRPQATVDWGFLERYIDASQSSAARPWAAFSIRSLENYRRGDFEPAITHLQTAPDDLPPHQKIISASLLAMATSQVGDREAAEKHLSDARALMASLYPDGIATTWYWHDWVMADFLLGEAERLVPDRSLPESSKAEQRPAESPRRTTD